MANEEQAPAERKQDESLIDFLRRLTVAERLALNDASVRAALELRAAFKRRRGVDVDDVAR